MSTYSTALEQAVIEAALDLFEASGSLAFCLVIPGTSPPVYIACGEAGSINIMMPAAANDYLATEPASHRSIGLGPQAIC
ncbi:hypothetical protein VARIO8X_50110 [Burkholderiales bacterium 8X]|nr:hypothetical protein VARIO8X_50110 [Burkholderiales bacterium 8X]